MGSEFERPGWIRHESRKSPADGCITRILSRWMSSLLGHKTWRHTHLTRARASFYYCLDSCFEMERSQCSARIARSTSHTVTFCEQETPDGASMYIIETLLFYLAFVAYERNGCFRVSGALPVPGKYLGPVYMDVVAKPVCAPF